MNVTLLPRTLAGSVAAISSKSFAHRMLIAAALSDSPCRVYCPGTSADIEATAGCLTSLGATVSRDGDMIDVSPIGSVTRGAVLDCGESGTTLRFILPVVCALGANSSLAAHGRLPNRPLSPLYEELVSHGMTLSPQGSNPFVTEGRIGAGSYTLRADVSSQFIGGLLFALSAVSGESELTLTGKIESKKYIDMTIDVLRLFGSDVRWESDTVLRLTGRGRLRSPGECAVEGDWSNSAFWITAGAVSGCVCCTGLSSTSAQGDRAVVDILRSAGADIENEGDSYICRSSYLSPMEIDASDVPDLVPILAVAACAADGVTVIRGAARLRFKESDRIATVASMLRSLGGNVTENDDGLTVCGTGCLRGGTVDSANDHRIAMSAAVASCICREPVTIKGAEAVNKSYPGFYGDFAMLGGSVTKSDSK
jgi:3-phosphoshikimate 1-carboxyvinyltransferase